MEMNHLVVSIRMMNEVLAEYMLNRLSAEKSASVKKIAPLLGSLCGCPHGSFGLYTYRKI